MAFTIGKYGVGLAGADGKLMGAFYLTCGLFMVLVLGAIARYTGFSSSSSSATSAKSC